MVVILYQYFSRHFWISCETGLLVVPIVSNVELNGRNTTANVTSYALPGLGQFYELKKTISEVESDARATGC
jgi:hypothetical protein